MSLIVSMLQGITRVVHLRSILGKYVLALHEFMRKRTLLSHHIKQRPRLKETINLKHTKGFKKRSTAASIVPVPDIYPFICPYRKITVMRLGVEIQVVLI